MMHARTTLLALLLLALVAPASAARAADDRFALEASVDRSKTTVGDEITLTIKVFGVYEQFEDPPLQDLELVGRRSRARNVLVEGKPVEFREILYRLRPQRAGELTIGAATMRKGSRTARSKPITVTVAPPPEPVAPSVAADLSRHRGEDMFLQAYARKDAYWVGEPFLLFWDVVSKPDLLVRPLNVHAAPKLEGLRTEEILVAQGQIDTVEIGGKPYKKRPYSRLLAVADTPGDKIVDPMQLNVAVEDLFDKARLRAEPVVVKVRELPAGAPEGFRPGNVGRFEMEVTLTARDGEKIPDRLRARDELILDVVVRGGGNLPDLQPPQLVGAEPFEVDVAYPRDSQVVKKDLSGITGERRFRFELRPVETGAYLTPTVRFVYFDPSRETYATLEDKGRPIVVDATMTPLMGGRTLGTDGKNGARVELGWPGLFVTYVFGVADDLDISPQLGFVWGRNIRVGWIGLELGAEVRWNVWEDGQLALALLFEPAFLLLSPTTKNSTEQLGLRVPIPTVRFSAQVASAIEVFAGLRLPMDLYFSGGEPMLFSPQLEGGVEAQVHRTDDAVVNFIGSASVGPSVCMAGVCDDDPVGIALRLLLGVGVIW